MTEQGPRGVEAQDVAVLTPERRDELNGFVVSDLTPIIPGGEAGYRSFAEKVIEKYSGELTELIEREQLLKKKKFKEKDRQRITRDLLLEKFENAELKELLDGGEYKQGFRGSVENRGPLWDDPTEEEVKDNEQVNKRVGLRVAVAVKIARDLNIFDPNYSKDNHDAYWWIASSLLDNEWKLPAPISSAALEAPSSKVARVSEEQAEDRAATLRDFDFEDYISVVAEGAKVNAGEFAGYPIPVEVALVGFGEIGWDDLSVAEKQWIDDAMQRAAAGTYDFEVRYSKDPVTGQPQLELVPKTG